MPLVQFTRRSWLATALGSGIGVLTMKPAIGIAMTAQVQADSQALHVLNRLSFGPMAGELERVQRIGVNHYIEEQLNPEHLMLPEHLARTLDQLTSPKLSQRELIETFREVQAAAKDDSDVGKAKRREWIETLSLEASEARLWQALQSPRQLYEVMIDFWFNHFNVFSGKGLDRILIESYEREAIRPYALGRFKDLLRATAHHPAMLFYLDNWLSVAPGYRPRGAGSLAKASGLNENYARELMELHTLGVDGGYSQRDVTELARILTGWTFNPRRTNNESTFFFNELTHDQESKQWLGRTVLPDGQAEGEMALEVLASHPATAQHIGFKLAQYFVADEPPKALVRELAKRFLDTDGDIRAMLKTLFHSSAFRDPANYGKKFKAPYRYVLSSVRAADLPVANVRPLVGVMAQLGMPLFGCQTPDGYKNTEEAWLNPDAMTRRINFATALASGKLPLERPPSELLADEKKFNSPKQIMQAMRAPMNPDWTTPPVQVESLLATLGSSISSQTRAAIADSEPALRAALVLGGPDFMRY